MSVGSTCQLMANQTAKLANQLGAPGPEAVYRTGEDLNSPLASPPADVPFVGNVISPSTAAFGGP